MFCTFYGKVPWQAWTSFEEWRWRFQIISLKLWILNSRLFNWVILNQFLPREDDFSSDKGLKFVPYFAFDIPYVEYLFDRKWQDYVYIQCEYKSTWQKIKHLLREENKVKENKIP